MTCRSGCPQRAKNLWYKEDKVKGKSLWLAVMVLLVLWPASVVLADEPVVQLDGGRIFVDQDVSLEPGETSNGSLGVFGGDLTVPETSVVNGDVFVTNGDIHLSGRVNGNLAVINGDLSLGETGRVDGDVFGMSGDQEIAGRVGGDLSGMFGSVDLLSTAVVGGNLMMMSGNLERQEGAQVLGEEMPQITLPPMPFLSERLRLPATPLVPEQIQPPVQPEQTPSVPVRPFLPRQETFGQRIGHFVGRVLAAAFFSLLLIAVGMLVVFIWPRQTRRVTDCITTLPVQSFGLGLLTFLIAAVLEALATVLVILIILLAAALISTVILIPIGLLLILLSVLVLLPVPLALVGAVVLGWVGLAELIGQRALKLLKAGPAGSLGAVLVGLLISVLLAATLWVIKPVCCAWPYVILLTSVGLGAVIHTRFGRQSCRPSGPAAGQGPRAVEPEPLPVAAMDEEAGQPDGPVTGNP
jgi:cytoskeletal protein CcmA (bactofilin family)